MVGSSSPTFSSRSAGAWTATACRSSDTVRYGPYIEGWRNVGRLAVRTGDEHGRVAPGPAPISAGAHAPAVPPVRLPQRRGGHGTAHHALAPRYRPAGHGLRRPGRTGGELAVGPGIPPVPPGRLALRRGPAAAGRVRAAGRGARQPPGVPDDLPPVPV